MNKRVLVTGGAGYIGSHVVKQLGESKFDITIIDNLTAGFSENVLHGNLVKGDLSDLNLLESLFKNNKFDAVLHFAGSIIVPESVEDPTKYYSNNTRNSLELIKLCVKYAVPNFIFSSTAAVYGIGNENGFDETLPTQPINPYGRSKLMTEWMLEDTALAHKNFNYIALRYFNVSGADLDGKIGQRTPNATHLIKVAIEAALGKRDKMQIFGNDYETTDGTCVRDFIHVVDLATAHLNALDYLSTNKQSHILNCGYGQGFSVKDVIAMVKDISGVDFAVEEIERRAGDPAKVISIPAKISKVLGWKPKHNNLREIIESAYNWEKKLQDESI